MARKLRGLQRVLDARTLFSVAYGEIASSIYFALGIIAAHALGLTPAVLLLVGLLFLVVSLSYAEGTAAIPETGGAATFVRRAFNDLAGFMTGWALFLDYLIVISLSALFIPHYLASAIERPGLREHPWDVVIAVCVILGIAGIRLVRRPGLYRLGIMIFVLDIVSQLLLVGLGLAFLFSPGDISHELHLGVSPTWHALAFSLPLAMLAYTGLETVANLSEEARSPGQDLPRSMFAAIGLTVVIYVLIAVVGISAYPPHDGQTALGTVWLRAPLQGIVAALAGPLPNLAADVLRVFVGLTGVLILAIAATTSISGFSRLAYSLGEHGQLPRAFGRLNRRSLVAPQAILLAAALSCGILVVMSVAVDDDVAFLASLFSFGVLLAFTAAQLAVIRLRISEPLLSRPFRVPLNVRWRDADVPVPALVGSLATFAVWIVAMVTHAGARYAGPVWLLLGLVVYGAVRHVRGAGLLEHVEAPPELPPDPFSTILVPLKLGPIGEEMLATAIRIAQEHDDRVDAIYVIRVPLDLPLDADLPEEDERAAAALAEAALLGEEHGVAVTGKVVRARTIGDAIVREAREGRFDLVVLGSSPRWRRQSRFFSPTVEYVLKKAPCEVLVVAFPQGALEEEVHA